MVTAYSAENDASKMDQNVYSYDHSPASCWRVHIEEPQAVLVQNYTVQAYESITAVGVETDLNEPTDRLDLSVKVTAGGQTAAGSISNVGEGFFRIAVSPTISFTADSVVTVEVTYKARTSGMLILVPYEAEEVVRMGGKIGSYVISSGQDGGGWTVNGKPQEGDPHLKLYTRDRSDAVKVTGITLDKTSVPDAKVTLPFQLNATVSPSNASNQRVSWTSSNTAVAEVDQNGVVTPLEPGETTITATTASGGYTATCKVIVPAAKPTGIKINGYTSNPFTINNDNCGTFWFGKTLTIRCEFIPVYATDRAVKWSSSNPAVFEFTNSEDTTAEFLAKGNGITTIRVQSVAYPEIYAEQQIILDLHRLVESVSLDQASVSTSVGSSFRLTATINPSDAENQNVVWTSSNDSAATVDSAGVVTGQHWGSATITVTTVEGGKTASCEVLVFPTDPVEAFIYRMYRTCLQRDPDEGGFSYWVDKLRSGAKTGSEAVFNFYDSNEMKARDLPNSEYLTRAYEGIMGRAPDAGGYSYWMARMEIGMSRKFIISGFLTSNEFDALCKQYGIEKGSYSSSEPRDKNAGVTGFISRLYTKLQGRMYDEGGLNYWCEKVLAEPTKATLLKVALDGFLHSNEFINKHLSDKDYLTVLYRAFLDREPDTGGMEYWQGKIASGMTRDKVAEGFAGSNEFSAIMARYGF